MLLHGEDVGAGVQGRECTLVTVLERLLEHFVAIYSLECFLIGSFAVVDKLCRVAQCELTHLHISRTTLYGCHLYLEVGIFSAVLLRWCQEDCETVLVWQHLLSDALVIEEHPALGIAGHFALIRFGYAIDAIILPVAMVKGCVVGSSHKLVVCRSNGTCGLEYCIGTLTILAVVGALL